MAQLPLDLGNDAVVFYLILGMLASSCCEALLEVTNLSCRVSLSCQVRTDRFGELRETSRVCARCESSDVSVISFALWPCRYRFEVKYSIVWNSSLQSSTQDCRCNGLANVRIGAVDLPYLQVPPQHLSKSSSVLRTHKQMITDVVE